MHVGSMGLRRVVVTAGVGLACAASTSLGQFVEEDAVARITLVGSGVGDAFGWVAEAIGDLDGDGASEFVVGAFLDSTESFVGGRASVYSGATGALLATHVGADLDLLGYSVAAAGDVDGDGTPDYLVASRGPISAASPAGNFVEVYSGTTHTAVLRLEGEDFTLFGADVNGAGDIDGDGYADIVVGATFAATGGIQAGRVVVFSGRDGSELWRRDGDEGDLLGTGVTGLSDVDGDGVPDVAAGARNAGTNSRGRAYVYSGADGTLIHELEPEGTAVDFGWFFVHDAGDVNADGVTDVYVSDFADKRNGGPGAGAGYVFSGADGSLLHLFAAAGRGEGLGPGRGAGDVNGDGHADLVIAAFSSSDGAPFAGKVLLYSGRTGALMRTVTGTIEGDNLGFDALALGDTDGDGLIDLLLTSAGNSAAGTGPGSVYVVPGVPVICRGDLDGDDDIDDDDLTLVTHAIGETGGPADLNGDGVVDSADVTALAQSFGPCP